MEISLSTLHGIISNPQYLETIPQGESILYNGDDLGIDSGYRFIREGNVVWLVCGLYKAIIYADADSSLNNKQFLSTEGEIRSVLSRGSGYSYNLYQCFLWRIESPDATAGLYIFINPASITGSIYGWKYVQVDDNGIISKLPTRSKNNYLIWLTKSSENGSVKASLVCAKGEDVFQLLDAKYTNSIGIFSPEPALSQRHVILLMPIYKTNEK